MTRRTTTKDGVAAFERSYLTALGEHVKTASGGKGADRIGRRAQSLGLETLDLARIHDRSTAALEPPAASASRTGSFFSEAVTPIEAAHCGVPEALAASGRLTALLGRLTAELAEVRGGLALAVERRKVLQAELVTSERLRGESLELSRLAEGRMRRLSRQLLSAQEDERMRISRDLHDAIGQTLTGINVGLATLKNESAVDSRQLADAIATTQRLVERSMKTVHQFAWELRPTLLDDLGLVPALRSYAKTYSKRTGVKVRFAADANFELLDGERRTALFRVAQGALSNVERHSRADRASLVLRSFPGIVRLEVRDHGRSFDVRRMESSKTNKHLGLLVMRERVEMVGGNFSIDSSPGRGTTVRADVPLTAVIRD